MKQTGHWTIKAFFQQATTVCILFVVLFAELSVNGILSALFRKIVFAIPNNKEKERDIIYSKKKGKYSSQTEWKAHTYFFLWMLLLSKLLILFIIYVWLLICADSLELF